MIDKALAKDLTKRYASAEEMRQDLNSIKNKMEKNGEAEDYTEADSFVDEVKEKSALVTDETEVPEETIVMTVPAAPANRKLKKAGCKK